MRRVCRLLSASLAYAAISAMVAGAANSRVCISSCGTAISACDCEGGSCAGTDGRCHLGQVNVQTGQIYRIRNARWPSWFMSLNDRKVHVEEGRTAAGRSSFRWTLLQPPPAGGDVYMMSAEYRPEVFMGFGEVSRCSSTDNGTEVEVEDPGPGEPELQDREGDDDIGATPDPYYIHVPPCTKRMVAHPTALEGAGLSDLLVKLERAPITSPNAQLLLLSFVSKPGYYTYVPSTSTTVMIREGDPGPGGTWFFDPPLPAEVYSKLPLFDGERCSRSCGTLGEIDHIGASFVDGAPQPCIWIFAMFAYTVAVVL